MSNLQPGDFDAFIHPDDVIGLDVYKPNQAPVQFRGVADCTTLVVWTQFRGKAKK